MSDKQSSPQEIRRGSHGGELLYLVGGRREALGRGIWNAMEATNEVAYEVDQAPESVYENISETPVDSPVSEAGNTSTVETANILDEVTPEIDQQLYVDFVARARQSVDDAHQGDVQGSLGNAA